MRVMRRPLVRTLVGVACAAAVLAPGSPANAASPTVPENRPTPLPNAVNGEVPRSRLVVVGPNCLTAREAGPSLSRLFAMARQRKVALGAAQCYRPLVQQVDFANRAAQPGNNSACVASVGTSPTGKPVGRSYHGWGKAADLEDAGNSLTFSSAGFAFMDQHARSVGWNLAAFALPGTACPEPWHWEWVGDGGNLGRDTVRGDAIALLPGPNDQGYAIITGLGRVGRHGNFVSHGGAGQIPISWVMVGAANTPSRGGYWMVGGDGGVFSYGNARFFGSTARMRLAQPVNAIVPSKSGNGYWLLAWDGGVFSFGDAKFYGSTGNRRLNAPVDGMARTVGGKGYWLVASDGGIFSFGDAKFYGSMGGRRLVSPVVGITPTKSGKGYWLVASDGGVFSFGDAKFYGSLRPLRPTSPVISLKRTQSGKGYWLLLADGRVARFGDAKFFGNG
jgi:hypothetical protein